MLADLVTAAPTRAAGDGDTVGGVAARFVASPSSTAEAASVVRIAGQHGLTVVARGAGTKLDWGGRPARVDVLLDTTGISGVVDHAAGDLVVVVRAGTPVAQLQETVATAGQQLALDSPMAAATVGGMLAVGTSGPRRLLYGTARDLLIGVTFVRGDGVVAKAGGRVVKNVAGYDFGKLLTGSYGTLGVITEAVFRLHPRPAARRVITATYPDGLSAGRAAPAVLGSQVTPTAVELSTAPDETVTVTVLVEGVAEGVDARAQAVAGLLGDAVVGAELLDGFGELPFAGADVGLKVTCSLSGVGPVLAAAQRLGGEHGVPVAVRGSAAGVLYAGLPADASTAVVVAVVDGLRAATQPYGGTVTVLTAPQRLHEHLDLWGPVPGLHLMRRLKDEMDPARRLSPGRFVGGI